jgi:uncharacterized damage-inducible protein DinB
MTIAMTTAMNTTQHHAARTALWLYNARLLEQACAMVQRLQKEAAPTFKYEQAVGPHVRHIIEHYTALFAALDTTNTCVDYDARDRDIRLQSEPAVTLTKLHEMAARMQGLAYAPTPVFDLHTALSTRLKAGVEGEIEVTVSTTLERELLFLSSHAVHHFAILAHYCRIAGVDLGHDFGKAPSTMAFERKAA